MGNDPPKLARGARSPVVAQDWPARREASHNTLRRETLARMKSRTTDMAPGPVAIDPMIYLDPARLEAERRELFLKRPILAGLTQDIPAPGDMMRFDVLGPSIVLARNNDGKVNAFLNMCRHRAAKVVTECSRRKRMTCRFHGWTYDLDGKLIGLPGAEGFDNLERQNLGLVRLPASEWHGLIFVRATPGGDPIDVADYLGDFGDELAHLELAKAKPIKSSQFEVEANWKYAWDTYGESYHFATLHPSTIGALSFTNIMVYRNFGLHARLGFPREEFMTYAEQPESAWPHTDYGGLYLLFPNVSINVNSMPGIAGGGQFYGFSRVFPSNRVDHASTLLTIYKPGHAAVDADETKWADMHDFIRKVVTTEDYSVSKDGQDNLLHAPEDFRMVFGANEIALQRYHENVNKILASASDRRGLREPASVAAFSGR